MSEQKKQVLMALVANAHKVVSGRISAREWRANAKRFAYGRGMRRIHLAYPARYELVGEYHAHMSAAEIVGG